MIIKKQDQQKSSATEIEKHLQSLRGLELHIFLNTTFKSHCYYFISFLMAFKSHTKIISAFILDNSYWIQQNISFRNSVKQNYT